MARPWVLLGLALGCQTNAGPLEQSKPALPATLIEPEALEPPFRGCEGPGAPALVVLPTGLLLLDGLPLHDEEELAAVLSNKRTLQLEAGAIDRQLVIQVFDGVPRERVEHLSLFVARQGFDELNVMHLTSPRPSSGSAKAN